METTTTNRNQPSFRSSLLAGALAGTTVDLALFPLDTLKTRLQAPAGFAASGGFSGVYRGVGSAVVASAPGAAVFFVTYEAAKGKLDSWRRERQGGMQSGGVSSGSRAGASGEVPPQAIDHVLAASLGEVAACAIRVPSEVVKQRAQAGRHGGRSMATLFAILRQQPPAPGPMATAATGSSSLVELARRPIHVFRELYRGFAITVLREVPFTALQFPLWELLRTRRPLAHVLPRLSSPIPVPGPLSPATTSPNTTSTGRTRHPPPPPPPPLPSAASSCPAVESAVYGSVAGGVAAAVTTPLDVLKTRVMLATGADASAREPAWRIAATLLRSHGWRPFVAGMAPRVAWIAAGGAVFLGSYQAGINILEGEKWR